LLHFKSHWQHYEAKNNQTYSEYRYRKFCTKVSNSNQLENKFSIFHSLLTASFYILLINVSMVWLYVSQCNMILFYAVQIFFCPSNFPRFRKLGYCTSRPTIHCGSKKLKLWRFVSLSRGDEFRSVSMKNIRTLPKIMSMFNFMCAFMS